MLSRRSLILSAAAGGVLGAGGALGLGFRFAGIDPKFDPDGVEVHNWVVVARDNTVTIRIAQMEMGQGAITTMAQLVAEELEVDWAKICTEFISITTQPARAGAYGRTNTAASEGVSSSQLLLRTSGAQIRTMLVRAAAARLGKPESEFLAKESRVTHLATGESLTYGELAADAAKLPVPEPASIQLKDAKDWLLIGKSLNRVDIPSKTDGTAIFGIDVKVPGMKHAAITMSPVLGGRLMSYEANAALSRAGVQRVVKIKGTRRRYEALAVVADRWWQAKTAIDVMPVEWGEGAPSVDSEMILKDLQAALAGAPDEVLRRTGDVEAVLASAARLWSADYVVPYLEQATMEPMNCTALVTDDSFEVWAPTQLPESAIETAAKAAGMPQDRGRLHLIQMGGGFGRRQESDFISQAVHVAKAMKGTPIKLVWTREDTMRHGFYRPANCSRVRGALDADGNLLAWWHRIAAPSRERVRSQLGSDSLLYAIPNMLVDFVSRPSNIPEGQMRGVGFATHAFVTQSFMDELATLAGKNIYEFQRQLLDPAQTPQFVPEAIQGQVSGGLSPGTRAGRLRAVLDEAVEKADWGSDLGASRGRGIAVEEEAGSYFAAVVEVTLDGQGWFAVDRVVVVGDPGFVVNPNNASAQVEGSVAFGLTSAMYGEISIREGRVVQGNFDDYQLLRIREMPKIEIYWLSSAGRGWGGVGEPAVAAVIPALANAIHDASGLRIRSLPLKNHRPIERR